MIIICFEKISEGKRHLVLGNITKQGIHKQYGISLTPPILSTQNISEKIHVSIISYTYTYFPYLYVLLRQITQMLSPFYNISHLEITKITLNMITG